MKNIISQKVVGEGGRLPLDTLGSYGSDLLLTL